MDRDKQNPDRQRPNTEFLAHGAGGLAEQTLSDSGTPYSAITNDVQFFDASCGSHIRYRKGRADAENSTSADSSSSVAAARLETRLIATGIPPDRAPGQFRSGDRVRPFN